MTFEIIKTSIISNIEEVRFYTDTVDHIIEEHPDVPILLPSLMGAISTAITAPTQIFQTRDRSFVFVDENTTNSAGDPFRVPVRIVSGSSGRVCTAHFAQSASMKNLIWGNK